MKTFTLHQLEDAFIPKGFRSKRGIDSGTVKQADPGFEGEARRISLFGDRVVSDPAAVLQEECPAFQALYRIQEAFGVGRDPWFQVVTFYTQLGRPDSAHEFSSLHPAYRETYAQDEQGFAATQAVIDDAKNAYTSGKRGYVTYAALGFENRCAHRHNSIRVSPVRHVLDRKIGIRRFFKRDPVSGKSAFSSAEAIIALAREYDIVYFDHEGLFYLFENPIWKAISPDRVKAIIGQVLGDEAEAALIDKVFHKLKLTNLEHKSWLTEEQEFLALKNGILHLRTLLDPHVPREAVAKSDLSHLSFTPYSRMDAVHVAALHLTATLGFDFSESRDMPQFSHYLGTAFSGNEATIHLAQEIMGYCLVAAYPIHAWFLFLGSGGNGKTTLLNVIRDLAGHDNTSTMNYAKFNRFSTAAMLHKVLNISEEFSANADWDLLKSLTGGGHTEAEIKGGKHFSFRSTAKLVFSSNEAPPITDSSKGFWDRAVILPFLNSFRGTQQEKPRLDALVQSEIDAIGMFALEGLVRLLKRGCFERPPSSEAASDEFRMAADSVRAFVEAQCVLDPRCAEFSLELYDVYKVFCEACGQRPVSSVKFHRRLAALGVVKGREGNGGNSRRRLLVGVAYDRQEASRLFGRLRPHIVNHGYLDKPQGYCQIPEFVFSEHETPESRGTGRACSACCRAECAMRRCEPDVDKIRQNAAFYGDTGSSMANGLDLPQ